MHISLKAARVNAGLTQKEVAERMGINSATIMKWEKGITSPSVERFRELCNIYEADYNDIFLPVK